MGRQVQCLQVTPDFSDPIRSSTPSYFSTSDATTPQTDVPPAHGMRVRSLETPPGACRDGVLDGRKSRPAPSIATATLACERYSEATPDVNTKALLLRLHVYMQRHACPEATDATHIDQHCRSASCKTVLHVSCSASPPPEAWWCGEMPNGLRTRLCLKQSAHCRRKQPRPRGYANHSACLLLALIFDTCATLQAG